MVVILDGCASTTPVREHMFYFEVICFPRGVHEQVLLRQGVIGIKVKIMREHDPTGKFGPKKPLPDAINIMEAKEEPVLAVPQSVCRIKKAPEMVCFYLGDSLVDS